MSIGVCPANVELVDMLIDPEFQDLEEVKWLWMLTNKESLLLQLKLQDLIRDMTSYATVNFRGVNFCTDFCWITLIMKSNS